MSKNDDMIKLVRLFEGNQFAGEPEQKPGDQVRGTDKAVTKGKQHPFHNRLVGEEISLEDKLSKRYQDMKDVQAKEKEQKKKEESDKQDVAEGKANYNFDIEDLKRLERIRDLPTLKAKAFELISKPSVKPMKPEKVEWFRSALEKMNSPIKVIKLMYDLMLSGEGQSVIGTRSSMNPNSYRATFGEQGVAEGVAESVPMADAVKVLKHYGAGHFKTTSNELHFYKNGRPFSIDLIFNDDATRNVSLSQLNAATRRLKGQGVEEGMLGNPGEQDSPVAQAITRRILLQRTDLLSKYGPVKVMNAIDEVADFVGDVDEIGSSDVSGWIRHVEQMLGNMEEGVEEGIFGTKDVQKMLPKHIAADIGRRRLTSKTKELIAKDRQQAAPASKPVAGTVSQMPAKKVASITKSSTPTKVSNKEPGVSESENPADKITLDVPLMIRIMEYAREDAKDDVDLHNVAEQLVRLSSMGKTLGMNDYDGIVGMTTEQKLSELGAVPPTPPTPPQGTATPTSGSVSPDEQTALNKIQTNPAMKQQFDKLMTQATPGAANKPAVLDPQQQDALEKIKTNAGLKGQYDRLIKQANPGATP